MDTMIENGLNSHKWTAYGYYNESGRLIAYLDYKFRLDTYIELGAALTNPGHRKKGLVASLIFFLQLKYTHFDFYAGTYEENISMRSVLTGCGFKNNNFYDKYGHKTNKIRERINPDVTEGPNQYTNSLYFVATSLLAKSISDVQKIEGAAQE